MNTELSLRVDRHIRSRPKHDGVAADLADENYACRAVDIPASAVDAPHIRQRLYWVALADADSRGRAGRPQDAQRAALERDASERALRNGSFWSDAGWLACHDGKARRAKPGLRLLVDGMPGRVGLWRIAGNAIVPQVAAEILGALKDCLNDREDAA